MNLTKRKLLEMQLRIAMFISTKPGEDMKGYSWSRSDFRELLIAKYTHMKEAIFIEGEACSKCHMMKPHAQKRAENNGYTFQTFRFDDENIKQFDVQAIPMLILREDGIVKEILNEEGIVNLISNK